MNIQEVCELVRADYFAHRWVLVRRPDDSQAGGGYDYYDVFDAAKSALTDLSAEDWYNLYLELPFSSQIYGSPRSPANRPEDIREVVLDAVRKLVWARQDVKDEETLRECFDELRAIARFGVRAIH